MDGWTDGHMKRGRQADIKTNKLRHKLGTHFTPITINLKKQPNSLKLGGVGGAITLGFCHQSKPYVHILSCPLPEECSFLPLHPSACYLYFNLVFISSIVDNCLKAYFPHQIQTSRKTGPCSQLSVPQPGPLLLCKVHMWWRPYQRPIHSSLGFLTFIFPLSAAQSA